MTLFYSNFVKKVFNEEISVWKPSKILIWLGIRINLKPVSTVYQHKNCQLSKIRLYYSLKNYLKQLQVN